MITESCTDGHDGTNNEKAELESAGYFVDNLKSSCDTSLNTQKKAVSDALYELQTLVDSFVNHEALLTAKKHVMAAQSSLKTIEKQSAPLNEISFNAPIQFNASSTKC